MSEQNVESRVIEVVSRQLGINSQTFNTASTLEGDLGADSLDVVEISMVLEEEFECDLPDDVLYVKTVGGLVDEVNKVVG